MEGNGEMSSQGQAVPEEPKKLLVFEVYKRRWFYLLVLCLLNCSNAMMWLTFAPVADKSAEYLAVGLEEINWLSLVFPIVAIPVSFGTTWMLDTFGLRIAIILGSWLNMVGALVRVCGTLSGLVHSVPYPVVMLGQTLCALAQPLIIFTPTKQAALWFPDSQRTTANMIATVSNPLGILLANVISPMIVQTSAQMPSLLIGYTVPACVACLLATVGIWSSNPPTPPSASAELSSSEPFLQGLKLLLKNKAYLILLLTSGSFVAVFSCLSTLLEQVLCVQGYTDDFVGMCNALSVAFGVVGSGALGLYVDKTKKFIEATKINMCFMSVACTAFSVTCLMPHQKIAVATTCSLFGLFGSYYPVAMELSVECSFPVGEAASAGLIFISGQVQSLLYILLLQALTTPLTETPLSTCDSAVLSWRVSMLVLAGLFSLMTCCFVIFFHTRYRRMEAEEAAIYGTKQSHGCSATSEQTGDA